MPYAWTTLAPVMWFGNVRFAETAYTMVMSRIAPENGFRPSGLAQPAEPQCSGHRLHPQRTPARHGLQGPLGRTPQML